MSKKLKTEPARRSLLEKTGSDKFKTVSARIPQQLSDDFDNLVERAKVAGFSISMSKVIISALQDVVKFENLALDELDKKTDLA